MDRKQKEKGRRKSNCINNDLNVTKQSNQKTEIIRLEEEKDLTMGFPGGAVVESPPANAGDTGSSPGLGGSHMPRSGWAREPQLLSLHV